jgi:hypothetical protein
MTNNDVMVAVPWAIFAAGMAAIGVRLAVTRLHGRKHRGRGRPDGNRSGTPGA